MKSSITGLASSFSHIPRTAAVASAALAALTSTMTNRPTRMSEIVSKPSVRSAPATAARASKAPQGLRRIRGIGPAYQRVLEQAGITRVQQVARWTDADVLAFAEKLKIRPDRITKDDWISQAKALGPDD